MKVFWLVGEQTPGRNIKAHQIQVMEGLNTLSGRLSIMYSTGIGYVKPRFGKFWTKARVRHAPIHARKYHLCYVFSTQRRKALITSQIFISC